MIKGYEKSHIDNTDDCGNVFAVVRLPDDTGDK